MICQSINRSEICIIRSLGLMVKLPAVGFMQAMYCTLWMSFGLSLFLSYLFNIYISYISRIS